jgi:hypothetical protein
MDLAHAVEQLLPPARRPARRVGAQVELIAVTDTAWPPPIDPAAPRAALDPLPRASDQPRARREASGGYSPESSPLLYLAREARQAREAELPTGSVS